MVAAGLALPWAVEKPVVLRISIPVQRVVPRRRLAVTAGAAGERRGQGKGVLTEDSSTGIIRGHHAHLAVKATIVITLEFSLAASGIRPKRTLATCHP